MPWLVRGRMIPELPLLGNVPVLEAKQLPWLLAARYMETNDPMLVDPTRRALMKSAYFRKSMTPVQASTIYQNLSEEVDAPSSSVGLVSYGGRINTVGRTETAAVQRDSIFKLAVQGFWSDPEQDQHSRDRARRVYGDVFATTGGYPLPDGEQTDGCYGNYCDDDIQDPACNKSGIAWDELYYGENLPRLKAAKALLDPLNIYHHRQSIRP